MPRNWPDTQAVIPAKAGVQLVLLWVSAFAGTMLRKWPDTQVVIPAKAGIQLALPWVPAFAGKTIARLRRCEDCCEAAP